MKRFLFYCFRMRRERRFSVFGAVGLAFLVLATPEVQSEDVLQKVTAEAAVAAGGEPWRYFLFLPEGYKETAERKWPMILWLHGRSLRGEDLERLRRYGPPAFLPKRPQFPYVVVCPQLPDGAWPAEGLKGLLDECLEKYHVDPDRVNLVGDSLGAMGAWNLAGRFPDAFASLAPMTAHGPPWVAEKVIDLPIRAWHGDADEAVPMKDHVKLIEKIRELGGDAEIKVIPGGTHGSVIGMNWRDPEWLAWLRERTRKKE